MPWKKTHVDPKFFGLLMGVGFYYVHKEADYEQTFDYLLTVDYDLADGTEVHDHNVDDFVLQHRDRLVDSRTYGFKTINEWVKSDSNAANSTVEKLLFDGTIRPPLTQNQFVKLDAQRLDEWMEDDYRPIAMILKVKDLSSNVLLFGLGGIPETEFWSLVSDVPMPEDRELCRINTKNLHPEYGLVTVEFSLLSK